MSLELPISLKIENSKGKILSEVNRVSVEYNLPAFLLECVLADILADIRAQSKIEILNDVNTILQNKNLDGGDEVDNNKSES